MFLSCVGAALEDSRGAAEAAGCFFGAIVAAQTLGKSDDASVFMRLLPVKD